MVKETLLESQIEAGKTFLEGCDAHDLGISTAMWLYDSNSHGWSLLLSSAKFLDAAGENPVTASYAKVLSVYRELNGKVNIIPLEAIRLVFYDDHLLQMFRKLSRVEGISTIRIRSNYINGFYIDNAIIYRNI